MCRYQPSHLRTSYWSSPTCPLASSKHSSMAHRVPATLTSVPAGPKRSKPTPRAGQCCAGPAASSPCPAPQEAVFPRRPNRRPVAPWPALHLVQPNRQPATSAGQPATQALVRPDPQLLVAPDGSTWGIPSRSSHSRSLRSLDLISSNPAEGDSCCFSISWASCGLVRKPTLSGTPASRRRSQSSAHTWGYGPAGFCPWRWHRPEKRQSDSSRSAPPSRCTAAAPQPTSPGIRSRPPPAPRQRRTDATT